MVLGAYVLRLLLTFSSIRFTVAGFMLRFLIPLDLSQYTVISAQFVEDDVFFPLYNFGFFVKNLMFTGTQIDFQGFNLIPLVLLSVFLPISSGFHYCSSILKF